MPHKLDIFRGKPEGTPVWVKTAKDLDDARAQVRQLAAVTRDDYFVFDSRRGHSHGRSPRAARRGLNGGYLSFSFSFPSDLLDSRNSRRRGAASSKRIHCS